MSFLGIIIISLILGGGTLLLLLLVASFWPKRDPYETHPSSSQHAERLDSILSNLESMEQRMQNLETILDEKQGI